MSFRLVPNLVILDDLERRNSPNRHVILPNWVTFGADYVKVVKATPLLAEKMQVKESSFSDISFTAILAGDHPAPSRLSGLLNAKFKFKGTYPTNQFRTYSLANKGPTTLSLTVFTQINFLAEFRQSKCDFKPYAAVFCVLKPLWGG